MQLKYEFAGEVFETKLEDLPATSLGYLPNYGWRQALQDAMAGPRAKARADEGLKKGDPDTPSVIAACHAAMHKRMKAILNGELEPQTGKGRDPLKAVAGRIVDQGLAAIGNTCSKDHRKKLVADMLATRMDDVKARIAEERKSAKNDDISIDDLLSFSTVGHADNPEDVEKRRLDDLKGEIMEP